MSDREQIIEQAAIWQAQSSSDAMDWDGFTAWLEADPRHRAAFDELELAGALVEDHREALAEPAAPSAPRRTWLRWAGGAIAAALVAAVSLPMLMQASPRVYDSAGASRTVALEDGSTVTLAPHSRLTVDGRHDETLALSGGAYFAIRHDPARAMTVTAGPVTISDIGTRFDVQSSEAGVRVAVAEGQVSVGSDLLASPVRIGQGRELAFADGAAEVRDVSPAAVASWRGGRLTYADTPLPLVAAELSRYGGIAIAVPEKLRSRRFSGTLALGDGPSALNDLAGLMGLEVAGGAGRYRLAEHGAGGAGKTR